MKTEFSFTGISRVSLSHEKGEKTSKHEDTDFFFDISDNLETGIYKDKNGLPTKDGIQAFDLTMIQGLAGSIHLAHEKGWQDSAEHLRKIIEKLTESFAAASTVVEGVHWRTSE